MGFKRIRDMNIYEIIRRWHGLQGNSEISSILGYDRKTVRKYINRAKERGLSREADLPPKEQIIELIREDVVSEVTRRPATAQAILEPYHQEIIDLINGSDYPLKPKIAFEVICDKYDLETKVSYSSFKRFVRSGQIVLPKSKLTCRIEVPPGSEMQVDYGYMGLMYDPVSKRRRKVYAFIATLSHSRHQYVEFVYRQVKESFVASHVRAFEYFDGVVDRIVLDNLKSGVLKPDIYDPVFNRSYQDMAIHYGCFLDPCRPGEPKHKGKVENQVKPVRQQFRKMMAFNPKMDISQASRTVKEWCLGKHGHRDHGTTGWKPYPYFIEHEKPSLKPLPDESFEIPTWKECKVHADHYIQFDKKAYSVPTAYVGEMVWAKATEKLIRIFHDSRLIKQHVITSHFRHTDMTDFPKNMQKMLDRGLPVYLQKKAEKVGPCYKKMIRCVLEPHAYINLRKAQGFMRLAEKYESGLLEKAARLTLDGHRPLKLKPFVHLVEKLGNQSEEPAQIPISLFTQEFIRPMDYFSSEP
jgi:transposase